MKDEVQPSNEEKCHETIKEISIIIWASWRIIVTLQPGRLLIWKTRLKIVSPI
jgi:hypothetical protein